MPLALLKRYGSPHCWRRKPRHRRLAARARGQEKQRTPATKRPARSFPLRRSRKARSRGAQGRREVGPRQGLYERVPSDNQAAKRGHAVRVPQGRALPRALDIARSIRPFKQPWATGRRFRIDLKATIDDYSRSLELIPVFQPAPERWFEPVMVVDRSISMTVWQETIAEFTQVLRGTGAFRQTSRVGHGFHAGRAGPARSKGPNHRTGAYEVRRRQAAHPGGV